MCITIQITSKSVKWFLRYRINNCQNDGRLPFWIFKNLIFLATGKLWRTNTRYRTMSAKPVKRFWRYRNFSIFKMAAIRHLGFWNIEVFGRPSNWEA